MNQAKVVEKLQQDYPGANIVLNPPDNPTEIVCEVDPANGKAIAVIDKSSPHYHRKMHEHYRIIDGLLYVLIAGKQVLVMEGQDISILPNQIHYAIGDETWIEVTSTPPWSPDDHILAE